jgi:UDP-N-acetylmuramoyl-tripeptide--D-alanyl-D-alanine ligase
MSSFSLAQIAEALGGRLIGDDVRVGSISTDSRTLGPGDLFVALQGPNFDGHDYLDIALQQGARAALVSRDMTHVLPRVLVADTRVALGQLGVLWRNASRARVLAITGSNGKTTLKEMSAAILAQAGSVLATRGNLNNDIGVPLTLCRLADEDYAVIELGANHAGEIDYLTRLVRPDVAVLNNAGRAHLEGFGSLEGVARAKAEIINGLGGDGVFVYNADDAFAALWQELAAGRRTLSFGVRRPADVRSPLAAAELQWDAEGFVMQFPVQGPSGDFAVRLALAGEHNRMNALAACAAAIALDIEPAKIANGLANVAPVAGRLCPLPGVGGARLVDDSYNANPESVAAAIAVLAAAPGRRTLVLGDLAELGKGASGLHAELGERAREAGIERLYACGDLSGAAVRSFGAGARHFTAQQDLIDHLAETLGADDSVLIKGSRSARMDRVVQALREQPRPEVASC